MTKRKIGTVEQTCFYCGKVFTKRVTSRRVYCPPLPGEKKSRCKAAAENQRYYEAHRQAVIAATTDDRRRRRLAAFNLDKASPDFAAKRKAQQGRVTNAGGKWSDYTKAAEGDIDLDAMDHEQLLDYIRNNRHKVRARK